MKCSRCGRQFTNPQPPDAKGVLCVDCYPHVLIEAERWRALMSSQRMKLLGTQGAGTALHIGLEIWGVWANHRQLLSDDMIKRLNDEARKVLIKYADDRRKEGYC